MKTTIFVAVCALLMGAASLSAQPLKIGVKAGVSTDDFKFSNVKMGDVMVLPSMSSTLGYNMGFAARLTMLKFISIHSELTYSVRDYGYKVIPMTGIRSVKMREQRIDVPVLLGINIQALRIFGGPVFTIRNKVKTSDKSLPFSVDYNQNDIDLQLGVGLDLKRVFIDIRYTMPFDKSSQLIKYGSVTKTVKMSREESWSFNMGFFF